MKIILHLEVDPVYDDPHQAAAELMMAWSNGEDVAIRTAEGEFHPVIEGVEIRDG